MKNLKSKGFTLVELLTVIAVVGILAAIIVPAASTIHRAARVATAVNDISQFRRLLANAAVRLGGLLPITEGGTTLPNISEPGRGSEELSASTAANFYDNARIEQVVMSLQPALLESYFRPTLGSQEFSRIDGGFNEVFGDLRFNESTQGWFNSNVTITGLMSYANVTRIECRAVVDSALPGVDGSNFYIHRAGAGLTDGRVAYAVYVDVAPREAVELARKINTADLMDFEDYTETSTQRRGMVTFDVQKANGLLDVYVYLWSN